MGADIFESPAVLLDELRFNGRAHFTLPFRHALAVRLQNAIAADFERLRAIDAAEIGRLRGEVERLTALERDNEMFRELVIGEGAWQRFQDLERRTKEAEARAATPAPAMPNGVEGLVAKWRRRAQSSIRRGQQIGDGYRIAGNNINLCADELEGLIAADNRDAAGVEANLDAALNCAVSELEMIAEGRDTVTGDRMTFEQAKMIARRTMNALSAAWSEAAQPAPAAVPAGEAVALQRWGRADKGSPYLLQPREDGYWTPWHVAQNALNSAPVQAAPQEGEAVVAAIRFLGELETVGNTRAGDIARGLRKLVVAAHPSACELGAVRELVQLWRGPTRTAHHVTGDEWHAWRAALTRCADELEAAIQHRGDSQEVGRV